MRASLALAAIAAAVLTGCGDDGMTTTSSVAGESTTEAQEPGASDEKEETFSIERADPGESVTETIASDPETVLRLFFTSGDADLVCGRLATENLLSSAYGDEQGCRQAQVPAATADAIEVKSVDTSGDKTEAVVIPDGGPNDGFQHKVVLVRQGDAWRVDSLEADIPAGP